MGPNSLTGSRLKRMDTPIQEKCNVFDSSDG